MLQPRDYQNEALAALFAYFETSSGNPLLVLPTGAGKSVILALFLRQVLATWPGQRIIVLTHVKELIKQNHGKLMEAWPEAPAGINSAGIGKRDKHHPILFAGIQSVYKRALNFDPFDLCIIDECHLVPQKASGMYRTFLDDLWLNNPSLKVIGMTATHYRMDSGLLTEGAARIFTDIAYELPMRRLIDAGHLAPLITKQGVQNADLTDVHTRGGDFIDSEAADAFSAILGSAIDEIVTYGKERNSWLIFTHSVEGAREVAMRLHADDINAVVLHGGTPKDERDEIIAGYKAGEIKALVNCAVLTTGFDAPETDLLVLLRATKSPALFVQICGRAMRAAPGKDNALVLDYGGNINRHGPVDTIAVKKKRTGTGVKKIAEGAPTRECPDCESIVSIFQSPCPDCGYVWPPIDPQLFAQASSAAIMSDGKATRVEITYTSASRHYKEEKPDSVKLSYFDGLGYVASEWLCIEHGGFATKKALERIMEFIAVEEDGQGLADAGIFNSTDNLLESLTTMEHVWRWPIAIHIKKTNGFTEVKKREFNERATAGNEHINKTGETDHGQDLRTTRDSDTSAIL